MRPPKNSLIIATLALLMLALLLTLTACHRRQEEPPKVAEMDARALANKVFDLLDITIQKTISAYEEKIVEELRMQVHYALNVIEGEGGPYYDDIAGRPPDAHGLLNYAQELLQKMGEAQMDEKLLTTMGHALTFIKFASERLVHSLGLFESGLFEDREDALNDIHQAMAFLSAAEGRATDTTVLGGVLAVQTALGGR